jgi:hypothetical protein
LQNSQRGIMKGFGNTWLAVWIRIYRI